MRIGGRRLVIMVLLAAMLVAGVIVPVPFIELSPGPTYNTLGEADGKPIISIQDTSLQPCQ